MASPIWVSGTGDYTAAASWSPAAMPVDGEIAYFTGQSNQDVTTNLTPGATGDAPLALHVGPDYSGKIGLSGGKLTYAVSCATVRMASRGGQLFLSSASTTNIYLSAPGGVTDFFEFAGTATNVFAQSCAGSWSITNGAAITNIKQSDSPNCTATIGTSVTALNSIVCASGVMINNSAVTGTTVDTTTLATLTTPGVSITNAQYTQAAGAVATMNVYAGGVFKYNGSGTISVLHLWPGSVLDARANHSTAAVITHAIVHPGANYYLNTALGNVSITNLVDLRGTSGVGNVYNI